ncbi:ketoacyl-synthetase C-terminal extension domain-containing protein, partial [Nocardia asteroides]|uniref:ketoacyl-synthetase C-terminal extension domain-containing protein n=1 Tax=Nocardia asteroides TaxID=1824 RepID=UPI0036603BA1
EMMGALSPDGRCHTFDARANGYVRGEGGGVIVLKPLHRALADGDRVHCVIKGGAVNNDGGGPSLTTPDRAAQEAVLREAYAHAGVPAGQVGYVELHGTGTRAGDPVEAAALGAVLGTATGRRTPLAVGSAKTNVGHLEGAAGVVGLLKAVLAVREGELPPSLHHTTPNPDIDLDGLNLTVQTELESWVGEPGTPRLAGVSAFGMGGTNAHLVLSQAPAPVPAPEAAHHLPVVPVVVSGRTAEALRDQAARLSAHVEHTPELDLHDAARTLAEARTVFAHRAVVLAGDRHQLLTRLERSAVHGVAPESAARSRTVLVFPGQGTQWAGMGRELLDSSPVFAARLGECAAALEPFVDFDPVEVLRSGAALERVEV